MALSIYLHSTNTPQPEWLTPDWLFPIYVYSQCEVSSIYNWNWQTWQRGSLSATLTIFNLCNNNLIGRNFSSVGTLTVSQQSFLGWGQFGETNSPNWFEQQACSCRLSLCHLFPAKWEWNTYFWIRGSMAARIVKITHISGDLWMRTTTYKYKGLFVGMYLHKKRVNHSGSCNYCIYTAFKGDI